MKKLIDRLSNRMREFLADRAGNAVVIFALATIPMVGFVGAAVDYSHANSIKAAMQAAADATALAMSKSAGNLTTSVLQSTADGYFKALFNRPEAQNVTTSTVYTSGTTSLIVNASATMPTNFMGVMGFKNLDITATGQSSWGMTRLRVALVLDNTGSMADDGKMTALKTATKNLLTQLQGAATTNGDVYVSIVPFVKDVNLDPSNYSSDYIYWGTSAQDPSLSDNNSWDANNGNCSTGSYSTRSSCVSHSTCSISGYTSQTSCTNAGTCSISGHSTQSGCTGAGTCSNSGETTQSSCTGNNACSKSQYTSHTSCTSNGGTWGKGTWTAGTWTDGVWSASTWTPLAHNITNWNGCVMDRGNSTTPDTTNNYDTNVASPSTSISSSLYAAEQYSSCPQAVMGLSYDWTSMTNLVNNMSPAGNTNQAIGLQLGWLSLVGGGPFSVPAMDPNYKYTQVIILLTDGLNTQDRWYTTQSKIDAREQLTCNNINAAGFTLYTIQVDTGGDPTSTLLQNCAGSPGKYPDSAKFFLLTNANQIVTTFQTIATNLSQLRISK